MDDTPKAFLEELRSAVMKKRVGQIALAVVLAEAAWGLLRSLVWYLIIPVISKALEGHTESVFFESSMHKPIPWQSLFGSVLEFLLTILAVFYLNRWIHQRPKLKNVDESNPEYSSVGEQLTPAVDEPTATDRRP
jgi:large-conductance mechanosensitive channel